MKKQSWIKQAAITAGLIIMASCGTEKPETPKQEEKKEESVRTVNPVERGKYLVSIAGCGDCHSPKRINEQGIPYEDPELLLSGHPSSIALPSYDKNTAKNWVLFGMQNTAAVGPWGVSFAANITSDATGIGNWTKEQFVIAMREGKYKGMKNARPLMPPMPWFNYAKMTDEDLNAIFEYLKSTKPVNNVVPAYIPPAKQEG